MSMITRGSLHHKVHELLANKDKTLKILGVSGPGGIGKTWAVEAALTDYNLIDNGIIKIAMNGSDSSLLDKPVEFIAKNFTPPQLPEPARFATDHFPNTRKVVNDFRSICEEAAKDKKIREIIDNGYECVRLIIDLGQWLNDAFPKTQEWVKIAPLKSVDEKIYESVIAILRGYQQSRSLIPWSRKNAIKRDLIGTLGAAIALDFKAMVKGFKAVEKQKYFKCAEKKITGCTGVLLIFDDYERLSQVIGYLLLTQLFRKFCDYELPVRVIIIGRDDLSTTDGRFSQYFGQHIIGQFSLDIMSREEASHLLLDAGYSEREADDIYQETGGFPYLLGYYHDNDKEAVSSALGAKNLYDRTVKWMTPEQREWLSIVVNLEKVNIASIQGAGVDNIDKAKAIMTWFENEPSLRDPRASDFTVNRVLRSHILRYFKLRTGRA